MWCLPAKATLVQRHILFFCVFVSAGITLVNVVLHVRKSVFFFFCCYNYLKQTFLKGPGDRATVNCFISKRKNKTVEDQSNEFRKKKRILYDHEKQKQFLPRILQNIYVVWLLMIKESHRFVFGIVTEVVLLLVKT